MGLNLVNYLFRSSGGQSDASDGKNDSDTSERRKKRSSSSSTSSSSHRHHRHHHKSSRSSRESDTDNDVDSKRRHRTKSTSQYDENDDNIYDLPKMPPVPVAVPPPQRYANDDIDDKKSVEQLYNKVTKTSSSKQASKSLQTKTSGHQQHLDDDDDNHNEDLYAQDSLIQTTDTAPGEGQLHSEAGFYENVGFEGTEVAGGKSDYPAFSGGSDRALKATNGFTFSNDSFITVGEALDFTTSKDDANAAAVGDTVLPSEALYDVPRSNRRVSSKLLERQQQLQQQQQLNEQQLSEAIYVNDGFVGGVDNTYDVPRNDDFVLIGEVLPENYDVARTRDSLSTIEEEHQVLNVIR